jgi:hypothetical protein
MSKWEQQGNKNKRRRRKRKKKIRTHRVFHDFRA